MPTHYTPTNERYLRDLAKIRALPSVSFRDRNLLPTSGGLYFVINTSGELVYIGKAKSLRGRWRYHHRATQVRGEYRIHWINGSTADERERRESLLIDRFRPPWNGSFRAGDETEEDAYNRKDV